jgi:hypothetical protein
MQTTASSRWCVGLYVLGEEEIGPKLFRALASRNLGTANYDSRLQVRI